MSESNLLFHGKHHTGETLTPDMIAAKQPVSRAAPAILSAPLPPAPPKKKLSPSELGIASARAKMLDAEDDEFIVIDDDFEDDAPSSLPIQLGRLPDFEACAAHQGIDQPYSPEMAFLLTEKVLSIHDEDELARALDLFPGYSNLANWTPLGGSKSYAAITSNQQGASTAALKELVTNGLDGILEKAISISSPEKQAAVQTMSLPEAWASFADEIEIIGQAVYGVKNLLTIAFAGDPNKASRHGKTAKEAPAILVVDAGAGRSAEEFPSSFLSLANGLNQLNKFGKSWTFGNWGMGGSGILTLSGERGHKAIISRRDDSSFWTIAFIRRAHMESHFEYFSPGGELPVFQAPFLIPHRHPSGTPWVHMQGEKKGAIHQRAVLTHGSIVKAWNVPIDNEFRGSAYGYHLDAAFNMVRFRMTSLPISARCLDLRFPDHSSKKKKKDGSSDKPHIGAHERRTKGLFSWMLENVEKETKENPKNPAFEMIELVPQDPLGQIKNVAIRVFRFPIRVHSLKGHKKFPERYAFGNTRIFYAVHGQTCAVELKMQIHLAGLSGLCDRILVEVDLSALPINLLNQICMSDRERLGGTPSAMRLKKMVFDALSSSSQLRGWEAACTSETLAEAHSRMAPEDELSQFFQKERAKLSNPQGTRAAIHNNLQRLQADPALARSSDQGAHSALADQSLEADSVPATPVQAPANGSSKKPGSPPSTSKGKQGASKPPKKNSAPSANSKLVAKVTFSHTGGQGTVKGAGAKATACLLAATFGAKEIDPGLFLITSCTSKQVVISARDDNAVAALENILPGNEVVYRLNITTQDGASQLFDAAVVYRSREEQALHEMKLAAGKNNAPDGFKPEFRHQSEKDIFAAFEERGFKKGDAFFVDGCSPIAPVIFVNLDYAPFSMLGVQGANKKTRTQHLAWPNQVGCMAAFCFESHLRDDPSSFGEGLLGQMTPHERAAHICNTANQGLGQGALLSGICFEKAQELLAGRKTTSSNLIDDHELSI